MMKFWNLFNFCSAVKILVTFSLFFLAVLIMPSMNSLAGSIIFDEEFQASNKNDSGNNSAQFDLSGFEEKDCPVFLCSSAIASYSDQIDSVAASHAAPYHWLNGLEPVSKKGNLESWVQSTFVLMPKTAEKSKNFVMLSQVLLQNFIQNDDVFGLRSKEVEVLGEFSGVQFYIAPSSFELSNTQIYSKGIVWGYSNNFWIVFRIFSLGTAEKLQLFATRVVRSYVKSNEIQPNPINFLSIQKMIEGQSGTKGRALKNPISPLGILRVQYRFVGSASACGGLGMSTSRLIEFFEKIQSRDKLYSDLVFGGQEFFLMNPIISMDEETLNSPNEEISKAVNYYSDDEISQLFCAGLTETWKEEFEKLQHDLSSWFERGDNGKIVCLYSDSLGREEKYKVLANKDCMQTGGQAFPSTTSVMWQF